MKRGISLIAVLMFMLAATAASIVLFKWIGSENFSSGARLKHSEAYQASESGLAAAQAWLSYKAADVGLVLGDYLNATPRSPYKLSEVLNLENSDVYLIGAEKVSGTYNMKFMSIGMGRDNSEVKQTAIFNVDGLYQVQLPWLSPAGTVLFDEEIWGRVRTFKKLIAERAVLMQDLDRRSAGGEELIDIKIGSTNSPGYLVLDGNFYVTSSLDVNGDVYVTGNFGFCDLTTHLINGSLYVGGTFIPKFDLNIKKDAYFNGGVNPNLVMAKSDTDPNNSNHCSGNANGIVVIDKNSTINSSFKYWTNGGGGKMGFEINGNLYMSNGNIDLTRGKDKNKEDSLKVIGNVYIANSLEGTVPSDETETASIPILGGQDKTVCVPTLTKDENNFTSPYYYWKSENFSTDNIKIRTYTENDNVTTTLTSCSLNIDDLTWSADPLDERSPSGKDLKAKLSGCDHPPIEFDPDNEIRSQLSSSNKPEWMLNDKNGGTCGTEQVWNNSTSQNENKVKLTNPYKYVLFGSELQSCSETTTKYKNEWVVVYIEKKCENNQCGGWSEENGNSLSSGKYIVILKDDTDNPLLKLPPTGDAIVMLYLPEGYPGKIELVGSGTQYNYFIFSDGDIKEFSATEGRKLTGYIFMNNCNILNTEGTTHEIEIKGNKNIVDALVAAGILQETGAGTQPPTPPTTFDDYIIPLSPRLKVKLESKNISKEQPPNSYEEPRSFHLVMPRVIRLKEDIISSSNPLAGIATYYNIINLNAATTIGSTKPQPTTCTPTSGSTSFPAKGVYTCTFNRKDISNFHVKIE